MEVINLQLSVKDVCRQFHQSSAQTKLIVLHYLAKQLHHASKATTPSAFFSQKVQEVVKQVQQLSREERSAALHDMMTETPTRLTEAYQLLDTNMKMAFWYRLANDRKYQGFLPASSPRGLNVQQDNLLLDLGNRDSNELVFLLRGAVGDPVSAYKQ
ncbi:MAG: orange carotenoid protein N-terminal domain-containing protein [Cyanobacteria bacterium P01_H01_bin.58]